MRNLLLGQVSVLIAAVLTVASIAPQSGAAPVAQEPETVLYSFCAQGVPPGAPTAPALRPA